jgi:hypothetical protein
MKLEDVREGRGVLIRKDSSTVPVDYQLKVYREIVNTRTFTPRALDGQRAIKGWVRSVDRTPVTDPFSKWELVILRLDDGSELEGVVCATDITVDTSGEFECQRILKWTPPKS